jgi:hypothetical protein
MEAQWIADRATLRALAQAHPDWGPKELAEAVGRCLSWAKKWLKRFSLAPADDQDVLRSRSRAHHTPYRKVPQAVVQRILEIREEPPENLHRTPGPKAILYYLRRDQALAELGTSLPRSSCTVWRILRRFGCILDAPARRRRPLELAEPMTNIELDFTDESLVPSEPVGKKQHGVESFNAIDAGTSTWLFTQARADFNAETARFSVIEVLSRYGCPKQVTSSPRSPLDRGSTDAHVPLRLCAHALVPGHHAAHLPATPARQKAVCGATAPHLAGRVLAAAASSDT